MFLGPELRMYIPFLNHSEPQNNLALTSRHLDQNIKNHKENKTDSALPRDCHFTSAKMCARVGQAGGAHSLNPKGLEHYTTMPRTTGPGPKQGLWETAWVDRYIVTVLEARTHLYEVPLRAVSCFAHWDGPWDQELSWSTAELVNVVRARKSVTHQQSQQTGVPARF